MTPLWAQCLMTNNQTLAVAESCTGGGLAAQITSIPGISQVFLGGVVSYSNTAKSSLLGVSPGVIERAGAVSEAVAIAMAQGAQRQFGSDFALATTGVAGPGGGSAEKPVGLVWMAIATPDSVRAESVIFQGDRAQIQTSAIGHALGFLPTS